MKMEKPGGKKHINNLIPFPGLEDRLRHLGFESLEHRQYEKAIHYFTEAANYDPEDEEIGMGLLLAYYEAGAFEKARIHCDDMLSKGIGDYMEIFDIYLMVLLHLQEESKVTDAITMLIEEQQIPDDKLEYYQDLLLLCESRMSKETPLVSSPEKIVEKQSDSVIQEKLFNNGNLKEQSFLAAQLAHKNIHPYMEELIVYLKDAQKDPFIQAILFHVLKEHRIEKEIEVQKLHLKGTFIPAHTANVLETPLYLQMLDTLQKIVEQQDPTLYEQITAMMKHHFFLLYPFEPEEDNALLWSVAYLLRAQVLYDQTLDIKKNCEFYCLDEAALRAALAFVETLEGISILYE